MNKDRYKYNQPTLRDDVLLYAKRELSEENYNVVLDILSRTNSTLMDINIIDRCKLWILIKNDYLRSRVDLAVHLQR